MSMMHQSSAVQVFDGAARTWRVDGVRRGLARRAGWLSVDRGRVWITRDGGSPDLVLGPDERLWLGRGDSVLVEPWRAGEPAQLCWRLWQAADPEDGERAGPPPVQALPLPAALVGALRGPALVLAAGLRAAAGRLLWAARSAEAMASRAQGSIRAGDSMASSGAVQ